VVDQKIGLGQVGLARCGLLGRGLAHCGLGLKLGLAGLVMCCETRSCHNDLEGHSNVSSTIYSFSILCLGHQQWRSLT